METQDPTSTLCFILFSPLSCLEFCLRKTGAQRRAGSQAKQALLSTTQHALTHALPSFRSPLSPLSFHRLTKKAEVGFFDRDKVKFVKWESEAVVGA